MTTECDSISLISNKYERENITITKPLQNDKVEKKLEESDEQGT